MSLDLLIKFLLTSLAVYRIAHMISSPTEEGPFAIFSTWRDFLVGQAVKNRENPAWRWTWVVNGFHCPHCVGFWIALFATLPLFYWVYGFPLWTNAIECVILWQALSGMTFVWKRLTEG
jgi:hypothetical protein